MSILKQVLSEAWSSVRGRDASRERLDRLAATKPTSREIIPVRLPVPQSGMKVVILNWKAGENDPFTVVNKTLYHHFRACGKNVEIIEITDEEWPARLAKLTPSVEFAFTWQGLGSSARLPGSDHSIWDQLKIPLICIHGDHPSHMPLNHELENQYCFHLYANADYARYSNRHFRRHRSASVIDIPQVHREPRLTLQAGNHFVVAKNINDPGDTERAWKERLPRPVFEIFMMAAETLKSRIAREAYVEIHDVLDDLLVQQNIEWLTPTANAVGYHDYHSQLDHHLRSYKTVKAVSALRDFPLRIYGRGWDKIARDAPRSHSFEPGRNMADSQELYYTRFGVIDVSPSKGLHDRTRRAMVNGAGFLSSANLEDTFADIARFDRLFYSFRTPELQEKCAAVLQDPDAHITLAQEFAHTYHTRFHFRSFVNHLDHLAKLATRF